MRKVLLILSVMLLSLTSIFAAQQMSVTWEWLLDDPEVNYYRYQLNGTDEDGWIIVDGTTSFYVADGLDPYTDYTLYLQRSYDGINWSETASATAEALLVAEVEEEIVEPVVEETPAEEAVVETVEEPVVVEEEVAPVAEEPVVAEEEVAEPAAEEVVAVAPIAPIAPIEPIAETPKGDFEFSFLVRPYVTMNFNYARGTYASPMGIGVGVTFDFDNVYPFSENTGLGIRWDIGTTQYPGGGFRNLLMGTDRSNPIWMFWNWHWADLFDFVGHYANEFNTAVFATIDARAGIADFTFGLGFGVSMLLDGSAPNSGPSFYHSSGAFHFGDEYISLVPYAAANLGVKFYIGDVFSVGIDGVYKMMIPEVTSNSLEASVVFGFTF